MASTFLSNSFAANDVWTTFYPVRDVYPLSDGSLLIQLDPITAHVNSAACASSNLLRVHPDHPLRSELFSMAMTAQAAGLRVTVQVSGTVCNGSYPSILHMRSRK